MIIKSAVKLTAVTQIIVMTLITGCNLVIPNTASTVIAPTTVCHATGDPTNLYEKINVTSAELAVHVGHASDIIPAPLGGCPTGPVVINDGKIMICHATDNKTNPYEEISISLNGLNGHAIHEGDIFPAAKGGCPVNPVETSEANAKITICHATSSKNNPYNEITISVNGLNGHDKHEGDIIPAPGGGCPSKSK